MIALSSKALQIVEDEILIFFACARAGQEAILTPCLLSSREGNNMANLWMMIQTKNLKENQKATMERPALLGLKKEVRVPQRKGSSCPDSWQRASQYCPRMITSRQVGVRKLKP